MTNTSPTTSTQRLNNRQLRRPPRREESTRESHDDGEDQSGDQQPGRDAEVERDLAEARPVGRAGDEPIHRQRNQAANQTTNGRNDRRLDEETGQHTPRMET